MRNPPHPGELVREECLAPLDLSVTAAARALGVSRRSLAELINGHSGISPEMAIRLSKAFGSEPETWLGMQMEYDLWHASKRASRFKVKRLYSGERDAA
jgi:addiction module HigA family antidote